MGVIDPRSQSWHKTGGAMPWRSGSTHPVGSWLWLYPLVRTDQPPPQNTTMSGNCSFYLYPKVVCWLGSWKAKISPFPSPVNATLTLLHTHTHTYTHISPEPWMVTRHSLYCSQRRRARPQTTALLSQQRGRGWQRWESLILLPFSLSGR